MVGIQWSWICSTITNHRKMNTLYEWKVHATIPVAGISSEDAWERYQTNYMESLNEPEAFWTTVSSHHLSAFLTICKNFSMDIFDSADKFSSILQCIYSYSKRTIMYHGSLLSRKSRLDPSLKVPLRNMKEAYSLFPISKCLQWSSIIVHFFIWYSLILIYDLGDLNWFTEGKLNACYNCIDKHLPLKADQTAIIWDGDEIGTNKVNFPSHFYYRVGQGNVSLICENNVIIFFFYSCLQVRLVRLRMES